MSKQSPKNRYQRRIIYFVAGIIVGTTVMILPALFHNMLGPISPFISDTPPPEMFGARDIRLPFDVIYEVILLALPAFCVILLIYWLANRRTRWSSNNDAVRWTRR